MTWAQARDAALDILTSEEYRASLHDRVVLSELPAMVEVMLWAYAYGRPRESREKPQEAPNDLLNMATGELVKRASLLAAKLNALPPEPPPEEHNERRVLTGVVVDSEGVA